MICRYCKERIPDEAPVIEELDGANVCEECHEERLEQDGCAEVTE